MRWITLLQQNDIHAQLEPHWEYFWENGRPTYRMAGGLARAATVINEVRAETNGALCLVDGGDAIHGTGPAQWSQGAAIVPALNALGIDLMAPGNWEFGFGPAVLRERAAELRFPLLACNVFDAAGGELLFPAVDVRTVGGVRVGFVGVATPIVTQTMPRAFGAGLRMTDGIAQVRQAVRRLRRQEQVALVVLVSHMGLPQDIALVREVGDVDVMLSAHTHDRLTCPVRVGKTLVMQSGFSGSFLGRLDVAVEGSGVVDFRHSLRVIDDAIPADRAVQAVVDEALHPYRERMAEVVGATATALHRMTVLEAPMDNLITDAYLALTGAEVAFSHGWRYGTPVPPGPVTMGDLWQMIPTNPEVFTTTMAGAEIRDKLEDSLESVFAADPMAQKGGYLIRTSGISAQVRLNNPYGARVLALEIGGAPYAAQRVYTVASAGEQDIQAAEKQGTGVRAIEALRRYFARHAPVHAEITGARFVAV
jgi:2',3'-cyclic-nucleotide 2'-phosphodiesterase (5'-nucleotidase family)